MGWFTYTSRYMPWGRRTVRGFCIKRGAERHYSHCTRTHTQTQAFRVCMCVSECKRECEFVVEFSSTNETRVMRCQNLTVSSRFLKCRTQSPKLQIGDLCFPISRVVTDRVYQLSQVLSQRHLRFGIVNKAQLPKNLIRISIPLATIR